MSTTNWDAIKAESEAEHRATLESEACKCGTLLIDHYRGGDWKPCDSASERK